MVVGNSEAAAIEAAESIAVTWKALPPVVETEKAEKGPSIWSGIPGNLCFDWNTGNAEKVKEALDTAEYKVSITVTDNRTVICFLEPRAALARWVPET